MIRKLDLEFELNKTFGIDASVVKQFTTFLNELTKADDYHIKDENALNSQMLMRILMDFQEIETNYFKYKSFNTQKFAGVVGDDQS